MTAQKKDDKQYSPPVAVRKACKKGLDLHGEYGGKGLRQTTVDWAEHFASGKNNEPAQARRMRAWFRRHKVDKKRGWDSPPTPGYVAWLLWGGDDGFAWVEKLVQGLEDEGTPSKKAAGKTPSRQARAVGQRKKTISKSKTTKKRKS